MPLELFWMQIVDAHYSPITQGAHHKYPENNKVGLLLERP